MYLYIMCSLSFVIASHCQNIFKNSNFPIYNMNMYPVQTCTGQCVLLLVWCTSCAWYHCTLMEAEDGLHITKYLAVVLLRHQAQPQHWTEEDLQVHVHVLYILYLYRFTCRH